MMRIHEDEDKKTLEGYMKTKILQMAKKRDHSNLHKVKKNYSQPENLSDFTIEINFQFWFGLMCVCVCLWVMRANEYKIHRCIYDGIRNKKETFSIGKLNFTAFRNAPSENSHEQTKTNVTHGINRAWLK